MLTPAAVWCVRQCQLIATTTAAVKSHLEAEAATGRHTGLQWRKEYPGGAAAAGNVAYVTGSVKPAIQLSQTCNAAQSNLQDSRSNPGVGQTRTTSQHVYIPVAQSAARVGGWQLQRPQATPKGECPGHNKQRRCRGCMQRQGKRGCADSQERAMHALNASCSL